MIIGIVGAEAAKFTTETEPIARAMIRVLLTGADGVASGKCPLGGIDIWAIEVAREMGFRDDQIFEFPPACRAWPCYQARNIKIGKKSDHVVCLAVRTLPPGFVKGGWEDYCYHCKLPRDDPRAHIKSGGCWTVKHAIEKLGKTGEVLIVE